MKKKKNSTQPLSDPQAKEPSAAEESILTAAEASQTDNAREGSDTAVTAEAAENGAPRAAGTPLLVTEDHTDFLLAIGFAIPFAAVACTTMKNAAALTLLLTVSLLPSALLCFLLERKLGLPMWLSAPITVMASMMLVSFGSALIVMYAPEFIDSLGIYVYLLAAYPVAASVLLDARTQSLGSALLTALRLLLIFAVLVMLTATIREFLAYNQLWGHPIAVNIPAFKMTAMRMPFAGFIVLGLTAALVRWLYAMVRRSWLALRKAEEEVESHGNI